MFFAFEAPHQVFRIRQGDGLGSLAVSTLLGGGRQPRARANKLLP